MGGLRSTGRRLGAAVALISALSLAGLATSQAAPSHVSRTVYVNGLPCNDLCKAYMAWSDQIMAKFRPQQRQARVVAPHKKPDRTVHHASGTRQSGLNGLAQLPRRHDAFPSSAETPHVQPVSSEPVQPITERIFATDGTMPTKPADAGVAANASLETTPVSATGLVSATQVFATQAFATQVFSPQDTGPQDTSTPDTGTTSRFTRDLDGRFALSLGLALCALLSLLSWACFRRWT
jgi:hypothetical protein